jgi:hypothetical protein
MSPDDSYITVLGVEVVQRNILLDGKVEDIFLRVGGCAGVFSDVLAFDFVFFNFKDRGYRGGHD